MTIQANRPKSHVGLWALLIAVTALSVSTSAQWWRRDSGVGVTVFTDINFSGQSAVFRDDTPNLVSFGWNDKISSLRIPNGETWEVCQDIDYGNQCQMLSGSVADLRSTGWNDRISSMRRINNGGYRDRRGDGGNTPEDRGIGVTVYANPNFGGQSASFHHDTPNLVPFNMNDKVSSIRILDGETWEMCQDINYENQCQVLSGSVADLRSIGWNDRISSLRRTNNGGYRDRRSGGRNAPEDRGVGVTVYDSPNFRGQSASVRGDTPNLVASGWNDKISSIRIPNGETWQMCQDIDYGNRCQVLSGSVADLRSMGWNDRISSLRRINTGGFRDRRSGGVFQNGAQQGLVFYDRSDYRGASTLVTGGSSRMGFSAWQGSVQLRGGGAWELCDDSDSCATIDQDVSDVSELGLEGYITSARIVNNSQYRRERDNDGHR